VGKTWRTNNEIKDNFKKDLEDINFEKGRLEVTLSDRKQLRACTRV
jgi:hypothetical protein